MAVLGYVSSSWLLALFILAIHQRLMSADEDFTTDQSGSNSKEGSSSSFRLRMPCPLIGPNMYGDLRYHAGCHLWTPVDDEPMDHQQHPEDKMKKEQQSVNNNKWLDELSDVLLNSTEIVNNLDGQEECEVKNCVRRQRIQCCRVKTRLAFPLYGLSLTSGRFVRILQERDSNGIQQPILYRHCSSTKTNLVKGRCHQSSLPRLLYVLRDPQEESETNSPGGLAFYQDLLLMPTNCDCLVQLSSSSDNEEEEEIEDFDSEIDLTRPSEEDAGSGHHQSSPDDIIIEGST